MSESIRILNLFTIMNRGGAETLVMNYYRAMDRSKIQFDFMVHREERGAYDDEIEAMGGRIYRMCPIYPQNIVRYNRLLEEFFNSHPEYKIIHSHMSELGYFAFKKAIRYQVPVRICHAHNTPIFKYEHGVEKLKRLPREWLARKMRKLSTDYFACSMSSGEWLFGEKHKSQIVLMPNAIQAKAFAYHPQKSLEIKKEMSWDSRFVIGHIGRFNPQKNHTFLIDIFATLVKHVPQSLLVLVGSGELENAIKEKVQRLGLGNSVQFLGSRSDVELLYQGFDIFLFPSLYEGFGNVLLEAQAAGLPTFTSQDVVPEIVKVTPLLHYIPLSASTEEWCRQILSYKQYDRKNTYNEVKAKGFDLDENASWLCNYYLNRLKQA